MHFDTISSKVLSFIAILAVSLVILANAGTDTHAQSTVGEAPAGVTFDDPAEIETDLIVRNSSANNPAGLSNYNLVNRIIHKYHRLSQIEKIVIFGLLLLGLAIALIWLYRIYAAHKKAQIDDYSVDPYELEEDLDEEESPYEGVQYNDEKIVHTISRNNQDDDSEAPKNPKMDRLISSIRESWPSRAKADLEDDEMDSSDNDSLIDAASRARYLSERMKSRKIVEAETDLEEETAPVKASVASVGSVIKSKDGIDPLDLLNDLTDKDEEVAEEEVDPLNPPSSWYRSVESSGTASNKENLEEFDAFALDDRSLHNHPTRPSTDEIMKRIQSARENLQKRQKAG